MFNSVPNLGAPVVKTSALRRGSDDDDDDEEELTTSPGARPQSKLKKRIELAMHTDWEQRNASVAPNGETLAKVDAVLVLLESCYGSLNDGDDQASQTSATGTSMADALAVLHCDGDENEWNWSAWHTLMSAKIPASCLSLYFHNRLTEAPLDAASHSAAPRGFGFDASMLETVTWETVLASHAAARLPPPPLWASTSNEAAGALLSKSSESRFLMTNSSIMSLESDETHGGGSRREVPCVTLNALACFMFPDFGDGATMTTMLVTAPHLASDVSSEEDEWQGTDAMQQHLPSALVHCDSDCEEDQSGVALTAKLGHDVDAGVRAAVNNYEWARRLDNFFAAELQAPPLPAADHADARDSDRLPGSVPWRCVESSDEDEETDPLLPGHGAPSGNNSPAMGNRSRRSSHRSVGDETTVSEAHLERRGELGAGDNASGAATPSGHLTRTQSAASHASVHMQREHSTPQRLLSSASAPDAKTPTATTSHHPSIARGSSFASSGARGARKGQLKSQLLAHKVAAVNVLAHRKRHDASQGATGGSQGTSKSGNAMRRSSLRGGPGPGQKVRGVRMVSSNDFFPTAPDTVFEMPYHQYKVVPALRERPNDLPGFVRCPRSDSTLLDSFIKQYRRRDAEELEQKALSPMRSYKHVKSRIPDALLSLSSATRSQTASSPTAAKSPSSDRGRPNPTTAKDDPLSIASASGVWSVGSISGSMSRPGSASVGRKQVRPASAAAARPTSPVRLSDGRRHVPYSHEQFFARPLHPAIPVPFGSKGPAQWKPTMRVTDLRAIINKARNEVAATWSDL